MMEQWMLNQLLKDEAMRFKEDFSWPYVANKASDKQVGGNHYKDFAIQPAEFCYKNNIPYLEATAIKYLCRWKDKGGIQDLDKAIHFIELLKEYSNASNTRGAQRADYSKNDRDGLSRFTSSDD